MKKLEWVIEREGVDFPIPTSRMPWARGGEDDRRFRRSLAVAMGLSLILALLFPLIELPLPEPWEATEVPERLASLIKQEIALPPPPPVVEELPSPEARAGRGAGG